MNRSLSAARIRIGMALVVAIAALAVAACGSASSNATSSSAAGNAPASSAAPSGGQTSVGTASGADGKYLVGSSGRALYLWVADPSGKSVCAGSCAKFWPPLTTTSTPVATGGVTSSQLGTITRSDGQKQVTYDGHPLYSFLLDKGKGQFKGQGSDNFGAKWWLVAPSGTAITKSSSSAASAGSSGSSGY
jgi:predicted lipoprotein with Yx(FWY)xxD motif